MPLSPETPRTAADAAKEREDFEELIRMPGWRRFVEYITDRYTGLGYFNAMNTALKDADPNTPKIFNETAKQMMTVLSYPIMQIRDLKGSDE